MYEGKANNDMKNMNEKRHMHLEIDFSSLRKKNHNRLLAYTLILFFVYAALFFIRSKRAGALARARAGARVYEGKERNDMKNENENRHMRFGIDFSPLRTKKSSQASYQNSYFKFFIRCSFFILSKRAGALARARARGRACVRRQSKEQYKK